MTRPPRQHDPGRVADDAAMRANADGVPSALTCVHEGGRERIPRMATASSRGSQWSESKAARPAKRPGIFAQHELASILERESPRDGTDDPVQTNPGTPRLLGLGH